MYSAKIKEKRKKHERNEEDRAREREREGGNNALRELWKTQLLFDCLELCAYVCIQNPMSNLCATIQSKKDIY